MRSIICIVIMLALIGLSGCAKKEAAPADQPGTSVIATEDFESGEVEMVGEETEEVAEEVVEEAPESDQH